MCGLKIPKTYQGKSMVPLMEGKNVELSKEVFLENLFTDQGYPRVEAVRGHEWKYIRYYSKKNDRKVYLPEGIPGESPIYEELFNIKEDPNELNNLIDKPENIEILKKYRKRFTELATDLNN